MSRPPEHAASAPRVRHIEVASRVALLIAEAGSIAQLLGMVFYAQRVMYPLEGWRLFSQYGFFAFDVTPPAVMLAMGAVLRRRALGRAPLWVWIACFATALLALFGACLFWMNDDLPIVWGGKSTFCDCHFAGDGGLDISWRELAPFILFGPALLGIACLGIARRLGHVPKSMGMSMLSCETDVRVGGEYRFVFSHEGSTMAFFGRYIE